MAPNPEHTKLLEQAQEAKKVNPAKSEALYKKLLSDGPGSGEAALRDYEAALMGLGELYRDHKKANELAELVRTSRSTLTSFAKAKTAKIGTLICVFIKLARHLTEYSSPAPRPLLFDTKHH